jgi:hypothetical protein
MSKFWRRAIVGGVVVLSAVLGAAPAIAQADQPTRVITSYAGKTTAQWSASWWQWAAAFPESSNPFTDTTGASCARRQNQRVFFLAGSPGTTPPTPPTTITRDCRIPADKAVLVPAINAECSSVKGDCGAPARSYDKLAAAAADQLSSVVEASVVLDGQSLHVQHVVSPPPPFPITFARRSPFGVEGSGVSVADGYYVLLAPLRQGHHTLTLHGALKNGFSITVRYNLLVVDD